MGIYLKSGMILFFLLGIVPCVIGFPFAERVTDPLKRKFNFSKLMSAIVCGYITMWAAFQLITVFFILTSGKFNSLYKTFFVLLLVAFVIILVWKVMTLKKKPEEIKETDPLLNIIEMKEENVLEKNLKKLMWVLFAFLVLFQIGMSVVMAFADGDDAFYIPISQNAVASGNMYRTIPYTGENTILDTRHGLAPFPIWIAFLSKASQIQATILAQSILGSVLLILCYCIYGKIAGVLFRDKKDGIPYFMCLIALLFLFGNYSFYSAETFLLTRTSQGKAVLANLVIPFFFWCLLRLAEDEKKNRVFYFLLVLGSIASWLCSTMGTFFSVMMIGIGGLVMAITQKKGSIFAKSCVIALPSVLFALFYVWLQ